MYNLLFPLSVFLYFTAVKIPPTLIHTATGCRLVWPLWPTFPVGLFHPKPVPFRPAPLRQLPPAHRTCPVLPIPSPGLGRRAAFMRSQSWAAGSMTACLVGEDRGTILRPTASLSLYSNIHSETPGAFYSTSNIRSKGKTHW